MSAQHGTDERRSVRVVAVPVRANHSPRRAQALLARRRALALAARPKSVFHAPQPRPCAVRGASRAPRPARRIQRRTSTSSPEGEPHPGGDD